MAIKIGKKSEEGNFKFYKGMGAFKVVALNPNKAELEKLTGRTLEKEPEYMGKSDEGYDTLRLTFYLQTDTEHHLNNGIDLLIPVSFNLGKTQRVGSASGKVQVIDKYGRTAWATVEDIRNKTIPQYKNGPANIDKDFRPACVGEESLIDFLKAWLNIPNPMTFKDDKWIMVPNPEESEVSLDIKALFSGNLNEISSMLPLAKEFVVKCAVGVKTNDDGGQFQSVFSKAFAKNAVKSYDSIEKEINSFQSNGGAPNTVFSTKPLHEYTVESTSFSETKKEEEEMPWD